MDFEEKISELANKVERLEEENKLLKQKNQQLWNQISFENKEKLNDNQDSISRRDFLKKAGIGIAGLGALSLNPAASRLKISKNGVFKNGDKLIDGSSGGTDFTQDLDLNQNNLNNVADLVANSVTAQNDLKLPEQEPQENKKIWVDDQGDKSVLKVKIQGETKNIASASDSVVLEDFEDGDISEYSGATSAFSVQSNRVHEGSYALKGSVTKTNSAIVNTNVTLQQGDTLVWRVAGTGYGNEPYSLLFGAQSESSLPNGYYAGVLQDKNEIQIRKYDGGWTVVNNESTGSIADEWNKCELVWGTDGSMTFTLYDANGNQLHQMTGSDTTYTSGGLGFFIWDETGYWDYVRKK